MAARKMTFSLPEPLARRFTKRVAVRDRSRFLAQALEARLREEEETLIRSCHLANEDPEVRAIEEELAGIVDPIEEPLDATEQK